MSNLQTTSTLGAGRSSSSPTYVLEYLINELADGITPAPQFEIEGQIPSDGPFEDSEQIYSFTVDRLGLIDLSLSGILPDDLAETPSSLGQRYVVWFWGRDLVLGNASPIQKANNVEGEGFVNLEALETIPLGSTQLYSRKGYVMPQGTVLRVANMAPRTPGVPFLLRLGILVPPSVRDDALIREALCCTESIETLTDSDADCRAADFFTPGVTPNVITASATPQQITIKATPVSPDFTTVVVDGPGGPVAPTDLEIQFPDTILFTAVFTILGSYNVELSNGTGCDTVLNNAFTVA
jgi:hypothetical protein